MTSRIEYIEGLSATLEVTCDTTAVTPRVDFVGQTNSSTYVVQITSKEACNYKKTTRAPSIDGQYDPPTHTHTTTTSDFVLDQLETTVSH